MIDKYNMLTAIGKLYDANEDLNRKLRAMRNEHPESEVERRVRMAGEDKIVDDYLGYYDAVTTVTASDGSDKPESFAHWVSSDSRTRYVPDWISADDFRSCFNDALKRRYDRELEKWFKQHGDDKPERYPF